MDSKSKSVARNVIARLMVKAGQPVLNQTPSFERWFTMLDADWDTYAAKVAHKPFLSEWTQHGWTREKLIGDCRLQDWDAAQRKDDKLSAVWAALEALRPLWRYRWHEPLFITAMDNLVDTFFLPGGENCYWQRELDCGGYPLDLAEFEWTTDETLWFECWVSYSLNAALCSFERNYKRELCYSEWQYRLRDRRYVAIYKAFATIRRAALAGAEKCPEGNVQLTAALALPGGMFDANGDMIWFQHLSASQRTEWDNLQKTLPSTYAQIP
jgi:hypothetical protein